MLLGRQRLHLPRCLSPRHRILRQEADTGREGAAAVGGWLREIEVDHLGEQFDRQLQGDAGAVAAVGLRACRPAVVEMFQSDQTVGDDGVRPPTPDVGDHGDAARVLFVLGIVESLCAWGSRVEHSNAPPQVRKR